MKKNPLAKFKIGLAVLLVFSIVLLIIVVAEASSTKQDTETYNKATNIADSINSYIDANDVIPSSLSAASIYNVPSSVTYDQLSSTQYRFCVDYKTTSSNFSASNVETDLVTSALPQDNGADSTYSDNSYLYLNPSHHKGENCTTITPYIYSDPIDQLDPSQSDIYN
jgi:hypothetical protein